MTIAVGFFIDGAFPWLLTGAIVAGIALIWLQLWQLWNEAEGERGASARDHHWSTIPTVDEPAPPTRAHEVIVVRETDSRD